MTTKILKSLAKQSREAISWLWPLWIILFSTFLMGTLNYYQVIHNNLFATMAFSGSLTLAVIFGVLFLFSTLSIFYDNFNKKKERHTIIEHAAITIDICDSPENLPLNPLLITEVHKNGSVTAYGKGPGDKAPTSRLYAQVSSISPLPPTDERATTISRSSSHG